MIPEKTNKAIFTAVSTYCPEKFLGHNAETGYPNTAQQSFRFEKTKIDFEETKAASMCWNKIPKGGSKGRREGGRQERMKGRRGGKGRTDKSEWERSTCY